MNSPTAAPPEPVQPAAVNPRSLLIVATVACLVMGIGLGTTQLWDEDEGYFASAAAEMFARGDWVVPTFNNEMFGHKPPLMYWGMMAGFKVFGVNELGARAASALFGIATALLTCILGTRLFNERVGLIAGIVMGSSLMFSVVSRAATPDAHLTFFAVLALYCFVRNEGLVPRSWSAERGTALAGSWLGWASAYAAMALGVLTKGPIGILFPMAVIGLYLLITTPLRNNDSTTSLASTLWQKFGPLNFFRTIWQMRPFTAVLVTLLIAGPWYVLVGLRTDGKFLEEFFGTHHFHRFSSAMDNHSGPFFYYILACLVGLFPWSIFAIPSGLEWYKSLRNKTDWHQRACLILVSSWVGVYLVIFSLASTKLPNYVLPAYPALAFIVAYYVDAWLTSPQAVSRFWLRGAMLALVSVGLLTIVGLIVAGRVPFGGHTLLDQAHIPAELQRQVFLLALVGIPSLVGGSVAWFFVETNRQPRACYTLVASAVITLVLVWNLGAPLVDRYQSPQAIATQLQHRADSNHHIATLNFFRPSMIFYAKQPIECLEDIPTAAAAIASDEATYLVTTASQYKQLAKKLPADVEIVHRYQGFPAREPLFILARRATVAKAQAMKHR